MIASSSQNHYNNLVTFLILGRNDINNVIIVRRYEKQWPSGRTIFLPPRTGYTRMML